MYLSSTAAGDNDDGDDDDDDGFDVTFSTKTSPSVVGLVTDTVANPTAAASAPIYAAAVAAADVAVVAVAAVVSFMLVLFPLNGSHRRTNSEVTTVGMGVRKARIQQNATICENSITILRYYNDKKTQSVDLT